jgi:hypothetical protein
MEKESELPLPQFFERSFAGEFKDNPDEGEPQNPNQKAELPNAAISSSDNSTQFLIRMLQPIRVRTFLAIECHFKDLHPKREIFQSSMSELKREPT